MSHKSEEIDHGDGRKSVKIHVNKLDVKEKDSITEQAKKYIEEEVIPNIGKNRIQVIVIHTPTCMSASSIVELRYVRNYISTAISGFPTPEGVEKKDEDFIVVEIDESQNRRVSKWKRHE